METGNQIQLVIGLIFLSSLIISLYTRSRLSFNKTVSYIMIWLTIAFGLILAYSYRQDFSSVKERVLGELIPARSHIESGYIIVNKSDDGHYYIYALINGKRIRFLVDTGASEVMITQRDANAAHVAPSGEVRQFSTANGVVRAYGAHADISIEPVSMEDFRLFVTDADVSTSLLGMSFLSKFHEIKFDNDKLYLKIDATTKDDN